MPRPDQAPRANAGGRRSSRRSEPRAWSAGPARRAPEIRVLESGTRARRPSAVRCPPAPPPTTAATSVPVTVWDPPAWVETLDAGDAVVVVGRLRRRFYQRPGGVGSRVDVEAELVGRARDRRRRRRRAAQARARGARGARSDAVRLGRRPAASVQGAGAPSVQSNPADQRTAAPISHRTEPTQRGEGRVTATPETVARARERSSEVVIRFAGDSGDGMQLTGDRFTDVSAVFGNDLATLPNYPAEIRAPAGTIAGVSSFQVHISDHDIVTPGDAPNVLVAMNPAALKANLAELPPGSHDPRQLRRVRRAQPRPRPATTPTRSTTARSRRTA